MGLRPIPKLAILKWLASLFWRADPQRRAGVTEALKGLIRSAFAIGLLGGMATAFVDPARYRVAMAALSRTPLPLWGIAALIIALHFLTKTEAEGAAQPPRT